MNFSLPNMPTTQRVWMAADHAGFKLKEALKRNLVRDGRAVADLTPVFQAGDDYPLIGKKMAAAVLAHGQPGILLCGTGAGMDIIANRFRGIRAVVARTPQEARLAREHNHANILVLGARLTSARQAGAIVQAWLTTPYGRAARHVRRVRELDQV